MKGNGQMPKAGDEIRSTALKLGEETDKVLVAARERLDVLAQTMESLRQTATEQFEAVAAAAEDQIDKSNNAINTIRSLIDMIRETTEPPRLDPQPRLDSKQQAVETALKELSAGGRGSEKSR